jgi:hypothetical protein
MFLVNPRGNDDDYQHYRQSKTVNCKIRLESVGICLDVGIRLPSAAAVRYHALLKLDNLEISSLKIGLLDVDEGAFER